MNLIDMKIYKNLAITAFAAVALVSCDLKSPLVKRSAFEQSEQEKAELQNSLKDLQESYAKQNEDLCDILNDLSVISRKTTQVQLNVEGNSKAMDQVELINSDIDAIRLRIDELEKEADRARKLDKKLAIANKTIKELRETLDIQEARIAELTQAVSKRDATIKTQQGTISSQNEQISSQSAKIASQEAELRQTLEQQVEMLYQAGVSFEDIADNGDFKLTGRKNKTNLKEYRKSIYETAAEYYQMAADQGHANAGTALEVLLTKIATL